VVAFVGTVAIGRVLGFSARAKKSAFVPLDSEFQRCELCTFMGLVAKGFVRGFSAGAPVIGFAFFQIHLNRHIGLVMSVVHRDIPFVDEALRDGVDETFMYKTDFMGKHGKSQ
jgi:hypothetical protein